MHAPVRWKLITNPSARFGRHRRHPQHRSEEEQTRRHQRSTTRLTAPAKRCASLNYRSNALSLSTNLGPHELHGGRNRPNPVLVGRLHVFFYGQPAQPWHHVGIPPSRVACKRRMDRLRRRQCQRRRPRRLGFHHCRTMDRWRAQQPEHRLCAWRKAKKTPAAATPLPGSNGFGSRDHKWTADVRRSYNTQDGQTDFVDVSLVRHNHLRRAHLQRPGHAKPSLACPNRLRTSSKSRLA